MLDILMPVFLHGHAEKEKAEGFNISHFPGH